jgi:hypothetical protein
MMSIYSLLAPRTPYSTMSTSMKSIELETEGAVDLEKGTSVAGVAHHWNRGVKGRQNKQDRKEVRNKVVLTDDAIVLTSNNVGNGELDGAGGDVEAVSKDQVDWIEWMSTRKTRS